MITRRIGGGGALRGLFVVLGVLAAAWPAPARAASSVGAWFSYSEDDISGFTTLSGNDTTVTPTMPFSVSIDGVNYSTVTISTNGWLEFGGNTQGTSDNANACIPTSKHTNPFLAFYWDDMQTESNNIRYGSSGSSPNRTYVIDFQLNRVASTGNEVHGQVEIHEKSNVINVRYRSPLGAGANGQAATIGFQGAGGSAAIARPLTCNGKILDDNRTDEGWSVAAGTSLMPLFAVMEHSPDDINSTNIPGLLTLSGDNATAGVTLPFTLTLEGTNYTQLTIGTNGVIVFGTTGGSNPTANAVLPTSTFSNPMLAYYWDDLQTEGSNIRYGTVGSSPNRTFIVDFQENRVAATGDKVNGQVQIHEKSNLINVKYRGTLSAGANGQTATIGFQGAGGASSAAYPLTANGKILDDDRPDDGWSVFPLPLGAMVLHSATEFSPNDISGFTSLSGDESTATPTLPFSFKIDGVNYSTVTISTNGWLEFGGNTQGTADNANASLPTSKHTNPFLAWYWDNLQTFSTNILYGSVGSSGNRTFIIDFQENRTGDTGNVINGQVQLHERSNVISVRYRSTMSGGANGQAATVGFQGAGGAAATAYPLTFNGKIFDDNRPNMGWSVSPLPICGNGLVETQEDCDQGAANGTSTSCCTSSCTFRASGQTCRTAADECDLAETCTGSAATCPADAKKGAGTACTADSNPCTLDQCDGTSNACQHPAGNAGAVCRAVANECDLGPETCTGTSTACPADVVKTAGTACTDDGNPCTTDQCNGTSGAPACVHNPGNAGAVCRAGSGDACDPAETCTGTSALCPTDFVEPSSFTCRGAAGECDAAETCTGIAGQTCPPDVKKTSGTACADDGNPCTTDTCNGTSDLCQHNPGNAGAVCRAGSGDVCDPDETCTGTSATCPADVVQPSSFTCRAAAGECDLGETCTGVAGQACPADAKKASGTACTDDGNVCTTDTCNGTSNACQHDPGHAGTTCRASAGPCDVAETCTGTTSTCPADAFEPSTVTCRAANGECDASESCTGSSASCPADAKQPSGTACTDDGNPCTADQCDGSSDACQHSAGNAGAVCRPAAGPCDAVETCDGTSTACPADAFQSSLVECRLSAGECDPAENCTGTSVTCPSDAKTPAGTACTDDGNPCTTDLCDGSSDACQHAPGNPGAVCRTGSGDLCDADELCTGVSADCPPDVFLPLGSICRSAADECDVAEGCGGAPGSPCPPDEKKPAGALCTDDGNPCTTDLCDGTNDACQHDAGNAGTICRASAGPCDLDEACDGTSSSCPADAFEPSTTVCRPSSGECDPAENCTGGSASCPADTREPAGTACTSDGNPCTVDECDGSSAACQHLAGNAGATCRPAAGVCDVAETCTGASTTCPADAFEPSSTVCRPSGGECDPAESCTGAGAACPADDKSPAGTACTDDGNPCSVDECDGSSNACQHPAGHAGAVCRPIAGPCDIAETCTGTSTVCPADDFEPSVTMCRASAGECDPAENCTGASANCPTDDKSPAGTACTDDGNPCSLDECDGSSNACQHPAGNGGAVCRPAAGDCDVDEQCTGTSTACPADGFQSSSVECRASAGDCDAAEHCTGSGPACPADAFQPSSVACRASAGDCDVAEHCTGASATCPPDVFTSGGGAFVCRPSAGACDPAESCTGVDADCPADAKSTDVCRPAAGICDVAESCDGVGNDCPPDAKRTDVCRPAASQCDVAESCDGVSNTCPADALEPDGTACNDADACTTGDACQGGTCVATANPDGCTDDFLCYKVKYSTIFTTIPGVNLSDQFEPSQDYDLVKLRDLCTPTNKNSEGVLDDQTHLRSYKIKAVKGAPRFLKRHVKVSNQLLPELFLDVVKPDLLYVPAAKSVTSPPGLPGPNTVDHYKCYKAKVTRGAPKFPKGIQVTVTDQFRTVTGTFDVVKPRHLCTPVSKNSEPVYSQSAHLVCYATKPAKGQPKHVPVPTVYVHDQFRADTLSTKKEDELCIPSLKTVLP